jgi:hypothetical protein
MERDTDLHAEREKNIEAAIANARPALGAIRDAAARARTETHFRRRLDDFHTELEDIANVFDRHDAGIHLRAAQDRLIKDMKGILKTGLDRNLRTRRHEKRRDDGRER